MDNKTSTIVNANDNLHFHWLEIYTPEEQVRYMAHIPLANYIIDTHCPYWWKNSPQSDDYKHAQHWICGNIELADTFGEYTFHRISWTLNCSPLVLMNDPNLKSIIPEKI